MNGDQIASIVYLVLLGCAVGGYFFLSGGQRLSKSMQQLAVWGLIFVGVVAAYGLWNDISRSSAPRQTVFADENRVVVPQSRDGHYYLTLAINGEDIRFVVDTGATDMVLTKSDARRVGLDPDGLAYRGSASTANGVVKTARVRLDEVALGEISDRNVPAVVNDGEMFGSLLGMTYLNRWGRFSFGDGQLILER